MATNLIIDLPTIIKLWDHCVYDSNDLNNYIHDNNIKVDSVTDLVIDEDYTMSTYFFNFKNTDTLTIHLDATGSVTDFEYRIKHYCTSKQEWIEELPYTLRDIRIGDYTYDAYDGHTVNSYEYVNNDISAFELTCLTGCYYKFVYNILNSDDLAYDVTKYDLTDITQRKYCVNLLKRLKHKLAIYKHVNDIIVEPTNYIIDEFLGLHIIYGLIEEKKKLYTAVLPVFVVVHEFNVYVFRHSSNGTPVYKFLMEFFK